MKSILEQLYLGNINEVSRKKFTKNDINKYGENDAFEKLKQTLSKEQYDLLDEYLDKLGMANSDIMINNYIQGFKTGLLIGIESSDIKFE